jgi:hypothetical protein
MFKWWQFKKKKEYVSRKETYLALNKKFRKEHSFIVQWAYDNLEFKATLPQTSKEAQLFSTRLKSFFGVEYGCLPWSYDAYSNVIWGSSNSDYYPLEKLTKLYKRIRKEFPEPYNKLLIEKKIYE